MLQKHLPRLMEAARAGYPIVCIEPADATVLKNYLGLLFPEESDLNKIRGTTWELTDYLNSLYRSGNLKKDFQAVNGQIAYHTPCHRKSKLTSDPLWLRDIPEANATNLNAGCTGLAIQFGLMKRNRSAAKNIGKSLEEAVFAAKGQITTSECSACRLQLYQWTASSARHPVELLASAYRKPQKFGTLLVKADQSTLQLFARFREEAKTDFLLVPTPPGSTIAHIRSFLRERWPTLTPLIQHSKFAANNEFVTEEYAIRSGDELSIIPPVSGG
jgi:molybdopterin converting factor small subunit